MPITASSHFFCEIVHGRQIGRRKSKHIFKKFTNKFKIQILSNDGLNSSLFETHISACTQGYRAKVYIETQRWFVCTYTLPPIISLSWACMPSNLRRDGAQTVPHRSKSPFLAPFKLYITPPWSYCILTHSGILQIIQTCARAICKTHPFEKQVTIFRYHKKIYVIVIIAI